MNDEQFDLLDFCEKRTSVFYEAELISKDFSEYKSLRNFDDSNKRLIKKFLSLYEQRTFEK